MATKPTIVFIPGAWHGPEGYASMMAELQELGYPCSTISLPSIGADPPLQTFAEDVKAIRNTVKAAIDKGQDVVIVAHSYGSVPGTEAVIDLEKGGSKTNGKGGVVRFVFMTAFVLPVGASLMNGLGGQDLPWFQVEGDVVNPATPDEIFYNDLPPEKQKQWIASLRSFSYRMFYSPITEATYKKIPSTYIYCEKDNAIPLPVQKMMVENSGVAFETETLDSSHSPFLSMPKKMTACIRRAAGEKV